MALRAGPPPHRFSLIDAVDKLVEVVGSVDAEVIFSTCIDLYGFVGDSECFVSNDQPVTMLPVDELFYLPRKTGAAAVMFTSKSSGDIAELWDCDVEFTKRLIEAGRSLGIPVHDHVLVEGKAFRVMSECTDLWPTC